MFSGQYVFDFSNKQLLLVGGQNGHGKSSLFDAIQWCLTGEIRRYRGSSEYLTFNYIINEHALGISGGRVAASVEVWLESANDVQKITRTLQKNPSGQTTRVNINGVNYGVREGAIQICNILFRIKGEVNQTEVEADNTKLLSSYFSTTQLLSQDQLHEFILASNPQDRFGLMEKVLGLDKYGSEFAKYLADALQVIKEEKGKVSITKQGIRESWLEVSTQLKEKEELLKKIGGLTAGDLVKQMSSLLGEIRQSGIVFPEIIPSPFEVSGTTLSFFRELKQRMTDQEDLCERILLMLQAEKPLFEMTEQQYISNRKELEKQLAAFSAKIKRRENGIVLAERDKTRLDSLIQQRTAYVVKQKEIDDLNIKIAQYEEKITGIEKNALVISAVEKYENIEKFKEKYNESKKDLFQIDIEIEIHNRNQLLKQLYEQMSRLKLQIKQLDTAKADKSRNLDQIMSKLAFLNEKIDLRKTSSVDQMIHDIQHILLDQTGDSCPVCGTDFETSDNLHHAIRSKWEETHQQLTVLEQELMSVTSKKNELVRDLNELDTELTKLNQQLENTTSSYEQNQLKNEQQRSLIVERHQEITLEELKRSKQSMETFIEVHSTAFKLLESLDEIRAELMKLTNSRSIAANWVEEQKKLLGKQAHYLAGDDDKLVSKTQRLDQYLLHARAHIEHMLQQVKEVSGQITALEYNWNIREQKAEEIKALIPEFNKADPRLESWLDIFYQQKSKAGYSNTALEQLLEKVEAFLSKGEVATARKEERALNNRISAVESELRHYEQLEEELEALRGRHNDLRSTIMTDYLVSYSESIDQLFMQISAHAIFKHVHLVPKQGKLFILMSEHRSDTEDWTTIPEDQLATKFNASLTFSSAQANVLAVCIFLSLALSQQWTPLEMIGIDDPFQNMDDINVFSFIDVISQVVAHKQVMISSHNEDFVSLIKNKSGLDEGRIGYIHFKSYSRDQIDIDTNCKVTG